MLARGVPQLNQSTQATLALLPQLTSFNRCVTHNLIPAGNVVLNDTFGPYNFSSGQPNYREFFYAATGVSGESQNFDGNGPYVRFQPGGGPVTVKQPEPQRHRRRRHRDVREHDLGAARDAAAGTRGAADQVGQALLQERRPQPQRARGRRGPAQPDPVSLMKRAIRNHLRDFIGIVVLILAALFTLLVILYNQKAALPGWVPGLGQSFYQVNAKFTTAQAVTPGQGQAIDIAGIQVGKVGAVSLEDGVAVVRMDIDPKYEKLIHTDSTLLLRPKTGLNDMVIEIDPGTKGRPRRTGSTIPLAQTLPNVQPDQILSALDADTREYLALLLEGGGKGLGGNGKQFSADPEALESVHPRPRPDRDGARGAPPQHPPLDPQLPADRRGAGPP